MPEQLLICFLEFVAKNVTKISVDTFSSRLAGKIGSLLINSWPATILRASEDVSELLSRESDELITTPTTPWEVSNVIDEGRR